MEQVFIIKDLGLGTEIIQEQIEKSVRDLFQKLNYDDFVIKTDAVLDNELIDINNDNFKKGKRIFIPTILNAESAYSYDGVEKAIKCYLNFLWNKVTDFSIVLLGIEDKLAFYNHCKYATFLRCPNVDYIYNNINDINDYCSLYKEIKSFDIKDAKKKLRYLNIIPPSNYKTHHSIANEWAVTRWINMFDWTGLNKPIIKNDNNVDLISSLYFKYLLVESEIRIQNWKKKEKKILRENGFDKKRIIYIDDEASKGWAELLSAIFKQSGAKFIVCPFDKAQNISKEELIIRIKSFIDEEETKGGADCYLIDLRLHEDDFGEDLDYRELSGHKITSYIKEINDGNQIVIFSASNKIWNIQEAKDKNHASGYVVKESPEQHYSNEDSYQLYSEFIKNIRRACSLSYLKDIYNSLKLFDDVSEVDNEELELLYTYPELVVLDNGDNDNAMIKACALTQVTFLESFIKERFSWDTNTVYRNGTNWNSKILRRIFYKGDNYNRLYYCYDPKDKNFNQLHQGQVELEYKEYADLPLVLFVLYLYYDINESNINLVGRIKYERNVAIAHNNRETILTMEILKKHFDNVIMPVLRKEYNK